MITEGERYITTTEAARRIGCLEQNIRCGSEWAEVQLRAEVIAS